MKQKILFIISILILNCFVIAHAEETNLPALPVFAAEELKDSDQVAEKSFFQKIKEFFGFGEEKSPSKVVELDITTKQEENQVVVKSVPLDDLEDLKLPSGFEDDLDLPQISKVDDNEAQPIEKAPLLSTEETISNIELPVVDSDSAVEAQKTEIPPVKEETAIDKKQAEENKAKDSTNENEAQPQPLLLPVDVPVVDASEKPIELAIPSYASEVSTVEKDLNPDSPEPVVKLQTNKDSVDDTKITNTEDVKKESKSDVEELASKAKAPLDEEQSMFENNEAKLLLLPDDDVVLGNLTEEAYLEFVDFNTYVDFFWINYNNILNDPKRDAINQFIANYDEKFNNHDNLYSDYQEFEALNEAFNAINKGDIYLLSALLRMYPILQLKAENGNSLLHQASIMGNYPASRLLVFKGVDISAQNKQNQTALYIAIKLGNKDIVYLLNNAKAK